jgi:hypothetical protein
MEEDGNKEKREIVINDKVAGDFEVVYRGFGHLARCSVG